MYIASRLVKEFDDRAYLASREHFRVLPIAYGLHSLPHAACLVHLAAEEAQRALAGMVGVVHTGKVAGFSSSLLCID